MSSEPKSQRPKVAVPWSMLDYALEAVAAICLVLLLMIVFRQYGGLPENVPSHFGLDGSPDGYHNKASIWVLPVFALVLYIILSAVNRRPDRFNYGVNISEENALQQYALATRIIRVVKVFVMLLFTQVVWRVVQIAHGEALGLGAWIVPVMLAAVLSLVLYSWVKSRKLGS